MICANNWEFTTLMILLFLGGILIGSTLPFFFKRRTLKAIVSDLREEKAEGEEIRKELEGL